MLTYMEIHLYFTLPALGVLYGILRPFHSKEDTFKYQFLTFMAFTTATVWDNYIIYHRAWSYCPQCVSVMIGYAPVEEYMFFVIMTLTTVAFTNLVMRWHLPTFYIKPETSIVQSLLVRFVPMLVLLTIAYKAWYLAVPAKPLFYGGCILWYVCPVLALLWWGSGEYMLRRPVAVLISISIPTIFLCWVDQIAIREGTWDISLRTSTGKFVAPNLPVEEFMFFLLVNVVLVFGTCAIDRAQAIVHLYKIESIQDDQEIPKLQQVTEIAWAYCLPDQMLNQETLHDLSVSWDILRQASKSFYTASAVFSCHARQDLGVLYGFCRATDDLCDDESKSVQERQKQLDLTQQFVKELFSQKTNTSVIINWEFYRNQLPSSCISAFKTFTRLRHVLQVDAIEELLDGYKWDLERRSILNEEDLAKYSACVASSVGEMCTRILLHHDNKRTDNQQMKWILDRAREMGLVLQYTNIARDIVTDSQELGRCYLPNNWLSSKELDMIGQGQARQLGEERLLTLSWKLIDKANRLMKSANKGIDALPTNCQGGVRAACNVYTAIGDVIKASVHEFPTRAHLKSAGRAKVALLSVYNLYARESSSQKDNKRSHQGKIRSFIVD